MVSTPEEMIQERLTGRIMLLRGTLEAIRQRTSDEVITDWINRELEKPEDFSCLE